jgi:hypothetical protein
LISIEKYTTLSVEHPAQGEGQPNWPENDFIDSAEKKLFLKSFLPSHERKSFAPFFAAHMTCQKHINVAADHYQAITCLNRRTWSASGGARHQFSSITVTLRRLMRASKLSIFSILIWLGLVQEARLGFDWDRHNLRLMESWECFVFQS